MFHSFKTQLVLVVLALALAACAPALAESGVGSAALPAAAPTSVATSASTPDGLRIMPVHDVRIEIGVGSPIPVDAFISAELPDICAQLAEVKQRQENFEFEITLLVKSETKDECMRDTLPFHMYVPLNMVSLPDGTYTVKVNGVSTTFKWPSAPTTTPEPISPAPANTQTYRNTTLGFEVDYPSGWLLESSGDGAILWSKRLDRVGVGGVPADVAKIDFASESGSTLTLDELVARQKKGVAEVNGKILSEDEWTLAGGLRAVHMTVSAIGDNVTLLTIINGHPVVLTGYGDMSRFDEVARTLRPIQP